MNTTQALGMIEVRGRLGAVEGLDASLKAANVSLVTMIKVGGALTAFFVEGDTGAVKDLVILSIPEGDDKPLKYPLIFEKADAVLVNKIDALEVFDFDMTRFTEFVRMRNSSADIFPVSAETGEGFDAAADWIRAAAREWLGR